MAPDLRVYSPFGGSAMKIGDLVKHASEWEDSRGIVLRFYPGTAMYTKVYWLSHKQYGSHPADDLEVVSESR